MRAKFYKKKIFNTVKGIAAFIMIFTALSLFSTAILNADNTGGFRGIKKILSQERSRPYRPKISFELLPLIEKQEAKHAFFPQALGMLKANRVTVVLELQEGAAINRAKLAGYGGRIQQVYKNLVKVDIPIVNIENAAKGIPGIKFIRKPYKPVALDVSEGVDLTGASGFQAMYYKGKDVKVAIIDLGFIGCAQTQAYGDLPLNVIKKDYTKEDPSNLDTFEADTEHGTAVAEVVYDMAPEAQLYLIKIKDEFGLGSAKEYCKTEGIDVINHSVGWFNSGPGDGTGIICDIANDAKNNGILWVNSAGNHAERHWQGMFTTTVPSGTEGDIRIHEFVTGDEGSQTLAITAGAGQTIEIYMRWNDWLMTTKSYGLLLYDTDQIHSGIEPVARAWYIQDGTQPPALYLYYDEVSIAKTYYLTVVSSDVEPSDNVEIEIFSLGHNLEYKTAGNSLTEPADADGIMAVGAIYKNNWISGPTEPFSSQGPTNAWAGSPERTKPDICGPDGVTNYTYGLFYGTSASSPHIAGAAALVLSLYPNMTSDQLRAELEANAVDMGASGKDNIYGAGRLSLPSPTIYLSDVVINEFVPNPDGTNSEWVELYNKGTQAINIGGCLLDDVTTGGGLPQGIPEGTIIPAAGYYVHTLSTSDGYLNNTGDTVNFIAPDKETIIDSKTYTSTKADCSIYRLPDTVSWADNFDNTPTKGAANDGPQALSIITQSLLDGIIDVEYSQTLQAEGGIPPYIWSVLSGSLPAGLSLDSSSGTISGIPTDSGASDFTIKVRDDNSPRSEATRLFSITIALSQPPQINPAVLDIALDEDAAQPEQYDLTQHETDLVDTDAQLVWSISGVNIELFTVEIDGSTDVLTVTPIHDANGSDIVTLTLTNSHNLTDTQDITITVNPVNDAPMMSSILNQTIDKGESFSIIELDDYVSDVDNSNSELIFTYSGAVNLDVSIDAIKRQVSIAPKDADWTGQETIAFTAQDPGGETASRSVIFNIMPPGNTAPALSDASLSPSSADNTTEFVFSIKYVDTEYDIPTEKMVVVDGLKRQMSLSSGYEWDGIYTFTTRLWESSNHSYHFVFSDGEYEVRTPQEGEYQGPIVTVPDDSAMLYSPKVSPRISDTNAIYEFSVWYFDAAGSAPSVKNIVIDGVGYSLNLAGGSVDNGAYSYSTTLAESDAHTYYFEFTNGDGTKTLRHPSVGSYNEPIVTPVGGASDLVVDDFQDDSHLSNTMGFLTHDDRTCVANEDVEGAHKLTWDAVDDYWYSCFAYTGGFLQAKKYNVISLKIKSEQENPNIIFRLRNSLAVDKDVTLSDYSVIDNNLRTVDIPLSDFVYNGLGLADLYSLALVFKDASGTIYIDDITFKYDPSLAPQETSYIPVIKPSGIGRIVVTGNKIFVNGEPFFVKSVGYQPVPIGETPGSWDKSDSAIYERDFPLLKAMGANTIKTWSEVSPMMMYQAEQYGLMVIAGFYIDGSLDLADNPTRDSLKDNFRAYVQGYKDRASLLMWSLGGEQNLSNGDNSAWYTLANELAQIAYVEEGLNYHPVLIDNANIANVGYLAKSADDNSLSYIDVWGITLYRGRSCGFAFADALSRTHKPVLVTEFGVDAYDNINRQEDQSSQLDWDKDIYNETVAGENCIGASVMAYSDEWWKWADGSKWVHDTNGWEVLPGTFPDNFTNEEFYGIMSVEDDGENIDKVHTRQAYYTLQERFFRTGRSFINIVRLDAPAGVNASITETDVNLTWNAVTGASGYNIYRSQESAGAFVRVNPLPITTTNYTDSGLPQAYYYYVITAVTSDHIPIESEPSRELVVNLTGQNSAPVVDDLSITTDEDIDKEITLSGSDSDGDSLTYEIVTQPGNGNLSSISDNKVTYTPNTNYNGADSFTYKANDGQEDSNTATVTITINAVNDPPTIQGIPDQQGTEDISWDLDVSGYINDIDIDDPRSSLVITQSSNYAAVNNQVITFFYPNGITTEQVTITVSDGELSASQTITVDITPVNDPPVVSGIPDQTIQQEESFVEFNLDDYVQDVDNSKDDISWSYSGNTDISVTIDSEHKVTLSYPQALWKGEETIVFTATDPGGLSSSDAAVFKVVGINHPPTIAGLPDKVLDEDTSVDNDIDLLEFAADIDLPDDVLVFTISNNTDASSGVSIDSGRYIDIQPSADWSGTASITIRVTDQMGAYAEDTFDVVVNPVNDPPTISGIPNQQATEDIDLTVDIAPYINDPDLKDDKSSLIIIEDSEYAAVNSQVITFNYPNGITNQQVTITVSDGELSASQTITVDITPVNDPPTIQGIPNQQGTEDISWDLDVSGFIGDIDNDKSSLVITEDSEYAAVNSQQITFNYPDGITTQQVTVTVSDGQLTASQIITVDITPVDDDNVAVIYGTVMAPDGQPLPGVTVALVRRCVTLASAVTDAQGRYQFDDIAAGYAYSFVAIPVRETTFAITSISRNIAAPGSYDNVDITLNDAGIVISGRVASYDTGLAIEGIGIIYRKGGINVRVTTTTSATGEYSFSNMPKGRARIIARPRGRYAGECTTGNFKNDTLDVNFNLQLSASIAGVALAQDTEEPLEGARVHFWSKSKSAGRSAAVDINGNFNIRDTSVVGIGGLKLKPQPETGYAWSIPAPCDSVYVAPGQAISDASIYSKRGALVTGIVKDAQGNPVNGILVKAGSRFSETFGFTDTAGNFKLRLAEGKNVLSFGDYPLYCGLNRIIDIEDIGQEINLGDTVVYSQDSGAKIKININNPGNYKKEGNFLVAAYYAGFVLDEETAYGLFNFTARKRSNSAGEHELGALPPDKNYDIYLAVYRLFDNGTYSIVFRGQELDVPAGSLDSVDFDYNSEGGKIYGIIKDENSIPVLGAYAVLKDASTSKCIGFATTDQNGEYTFCNVPIGDYTVGALHSLYATSSVVNAGATEGGVYNCGDIIIYKSFPNPQIYPAVPDINTDEDVQARLDLSQYRTDPFDPVSLLTWSVSGVNEDLFTVVFDGDTLIIIPMANANGSDVMTLTLTNSHAMTDTQDITVSLAAVNDPPEFNTIADKTVNEGEELSFEVNAADVDGDELVYSAGDLPDGASFDTSGRIFSWTPSFIQARTEPYIVTFIVSDGALTDSVNVSITVNNTAIALTANIISVTPSPVELGGSVVFAGGCTDPNEAVFGYRWVSSIDGELYNDIQAIFSTSGLSAGSHAITLYVMDLNGNWSLPAITNLEVVANPIVITQPSQAEVVSGIITVNAEDNLGVIEYMYLYVDSASVAGDSTLPYSFSWNTTSFANGSHTLKIEGRYSYYETYKLFGLIPITVKKTRLVQSEPVDVIVSNDTPDIRVTLPEDSAVVSGTVNMEAIASGAAFVFWYIDDSWRAVDFSPFGYALDTTRASDGEHTIYINAFYLADLRWITSSTITVTVDN